MNRLTHATRPTAWLLGLVLVLAACDSSGNLVESDAASAEVTTTATALAADLGVPAAPMQRALADRADRLAEPGMLWYVAADLQQSLTEAQKEQLVERMAQHRAHFEERFGDGRPGSGAVGQGRFGEGRRGFRGPGMRSGPSAERFGDGQGAPRLERLADELNLTDAQREELKALREQHREAMRALIGQRRDGSLTPETFREQVQVLREEHRKAMQALLTDEQRALLDERLAERQERRQEHRVAARAAMVDALDLTDAQVATLDALREEHRADREALREELQDLDREARRPALMELREAHQAARAEILTDAQEEIVQIHNALTFGMAKQMRGQRGPNRMGWRSNG